jgi:hypothetical protein
MLVFPQLLSGGNAQYPLVRSVIHRTVVNALSDGSTVKYEDPAPERVRWQLRLDSLNETERSAVEQLFLNAKAERGLFTLLDPGANLLSWSEDLSKSVWVKDALLQASAGAADPYGGSGAWTLTNNGQASQRVAQTIAGPAGFEYCFSAFLRGTGSVQLVRSSGPVSEVHNVSLSGAWQRVTTAGRLNATGDAFQVAVALPPGGTVAVFGPQLEAQPGAGPYRRSTGNGGVHTVRFDADHLTFTGVGLDRNSTTVRLVTTE